MPAWPVSFLLAPDHHDRRLRRRQARPRLTSLFRDWSDSHVVLHLRFWPPSGPNVPLHPTLHPGADRNRRIPAIAYAQPAMEGGLFVIGCALRATPINLLIWQGDLFSFQHLIPSPSPCQSLSSGPHEKRNPSSRLLIGQASLYLERDIFPRRSEGEKKLRRVENLSRISLAPAGHPRWRNIGMAR